jgi:hypothetical protein
MENNNLLIFDNENNVFDSGKTSSLQKNFEKFLKMRKDLRKSNLKSQQVQTYRDNPDRMNKLREKFINRAISYIGIPYGKRFLSEEHHLYNSQIFLDCCGLVRQCVNDLSEDFGFMLGRWNQAYQMDTLPDAIEFKDLKEGDLIFYEAIYYPEKAWKPQPHNLVHVEIYIGGEGTEEKTIAARDRFGVVEYNETYKFTSENYYDIKYHFRSIDTWLRGIHKSYCNEHKWYDDSLDKIYNKFSVFKNDKDEEEFAEDKI